MLSCPSISGNLARTVSSTLSAIPFLTLSIQVHGITAPPPACLFFCHFCAVGGLRQAIGSPVMQLQQRRPINLFQPQKNLYKTFCNSAKVDISLRYMPSFFGKLYFPAITLSHPSLFISFSVHCYVFGVFHWKTIASRFLLGCMPSG